MAISFRSNTFDHIIFESIVQNNEYRLPDKFFENDIIIDIGAHLGFFTYAVVQRGAKKVYAFEADAENYGLALENLEEYIAQGIVSLMHGAVWRSDIPEKVLYHSGYSIQNGLVNTGAGSVIWHDQAQGNMVPALSFDKIVLSATNEGSNKIRLLKIDCEGSEWPILFTSNILHLIDEICGEFHEFGGEYDMLQAPFSIEGYDHFTANHLVSFLREKDFDVTYFRQSNYLENTLSRNGLFFASNKHSSYSAG